MNTIQKLEWDSIFFGYNVALLEGNCIEKNELNKIIQTANSNQIHLIYWFVNPIDKVSVETASQGNLELLDNKIVLEYNIPEDSSIRKNKNIISFIGKPVTPTLKRLSVQAGRYSRFRIDKNIGLSDYKNMYYRWIENSLKGQLSDEVLVLVEDSNEKGFITLKNESDTAFIGLIAVDKKFRGHGIGKSLVMSAFADCLESGIKTIRVTTQNSNKAALGFYQKIGFSIVQSTFIYHIWIK